MKLKFTHVAFAATLVVSGTTFAQTAAAPAPAPAPDPLSFNIALTTNYKFRGQDQVTSRTSSFKPALQGGIDYAFSNGFYLGNWNSTVDFLNPDVTNVTNKRAKLEMDFYGGYKWSVGDWGFDIGLLQYYYPSSTKANVTEAYIGTSYGPWSAKYSNTLSRGYFGIGLGPTGNGSDGRGTQYLNFGFSKEVVPNWTVKAAVGLTTFKQVVRNGGTPNYTDYSLGLSYDFGSGLSLAGYIQGASQQNSAAYNYTVNGVTKSANRDTLLFTLSKTL
jgi:uncharacterized protein (TIGR02001 family)